jgi:arsenate reductase-like glutaredoxin family protein
VKRLGFDDPRALMRTKEPIYAELGLAKVHDAEKILAAMVAPLDLNRPDLVGHVTVLLFPSAAVRP